MHRDPTRHQRADANSRPDGDGARQNVTHDVRVCVSVCCVRASPCTTHAIGHLRPPPLPSSPRYVPLQKRENRRRDEEDDGATKRAIGGTGTAVSARYACFHARRRLSIRSPIFFPREFSPAFLPSSLSAVADGIYIVWKIRRLVSFDLAGVGLKKKEGEV